MSDHVSRFLMFNDDIDIPIVYTFFLKLPKTK